MTDSVARRLFQLVEPVAVVTYMAGEPTEAVMALGLPNVWDAYFAGRAAPLGREVSAAVVHALFYNFADGEVARHIPRVWDTVTPEAANAARPTPRCGHFPCPPNRWRGFGTEPTCSASTAATAASPHS